MASSAVKIGTETLVNTTPAGKQSFSSVTVLEGGGWVITWSGNGQGDESGIFQRIYDRAGEPVGGEILVNTTPANTQFNPSVAALPGGGWIVVWSESGEGNNSGIFQQVYDEHGHKVGDDTLVDASKTGGQHGPSVTVLSNGGWVVTWAEDAGDGSINIVQRIYENGGSNPSGEILVGSGVFYSVPSVTALKDGEWVVTWHGMGEDPSDIDVLQQVYASNRTPKEEEPKIVNTITEGYQLIPYTAGLSDGRWVVAWTGFDGTMRQQVYTSDGDKDGGEIILPTPASIAGIVAGVTALSNGGWIVIWTGTAHDGRTYAYQQIYDASGAAYGSPEPISSTITAPEGGVSAVQFSNGEWIVVWDGSGTVSPGSDDQGVFFQRFRKPGTAPKNITLSSLTIDENSEPNTDIGTLSAADDDVGDTLTFSLIDDANGFFAIENGKLVLKARGVLDAEATKSYKIKVEVRDRDNLAAQQDFTITINDVNERPQAISMTGGTIADNAKAGTAVATLRTADPDATDKDPTDFTYAFVADRSGETPVNSDFFVIQGDQVKLKVGHGSLKAGTYTLWVKTTDQGGLSEVEEVTLNITASGEPPPKPVEPPQVMFNGTQSNDSLVGNEIANVIYGQAGNDALQGLAGDDKLYGEVGNDTLYGDEGNDLLVGGLGKDKLYGGNGKDIFLFDSAVKKGQFDQIMDFSSKDDTLQFSLSALKSFKIKAFKKGKLNKKFFTLDDKAKDKDDYIVYNKKKGVVLLDSDGSGGKKAIEILKIKPGTKLGADDFFFL